MMAADTADQYAAAVGLPILARLPLDRRVRELADACRLALEVESFDSVFGDLAGKIVRREIAACDDYKPLEYDAFLRVFGAEEPEGAPNSASEQELFGKKRSVAPMPTLSLTPVHQVQTKDPVLQQMQQRMDALGIHVTDMSHNEGDGITVTSGAIEMRLGANEDMDNKLAFLAALRRTGQPFSFVDLRYADAPTYS